MERNALWDGNGRPAKHIFQGNTAGIAKQPPMKAREKLIFSRPSLLNPIERSKFLSGMFLALSVQGAEWGLYGILCQRRNCGNMSR
jgi:hypothetical protein